jgi:hypothetical protein
MQGDNSCLAWSIDFGFHERSGARSPSSHRRLIESSLTPAQACADCGAVHIATLRPSRCPRLNRRYRSGPLVLGKTNNLVRSAAADWAPSKQYAVVARAAPDHFHLSWNVTATAKVRGEGQAAQRCLGARPVSNPGPTRLATYSSLHRGGTEREGDFPGVVASGVEFKRDGSSPHSGV